MPALNQAVINADSQTDWQSDSGVLLCFEGQTETMKICKMNYLFTYDNVVTFLTTYNVILTQNYDNIKQIHQRTQNIADTNLTDIFS